MAKRHPLKGWVREIVFLSELRYIRLESIGWGKFFLLKIIVGMKPKRISRTDKSGCSFGMGTFCSEDFPFLLEMYNNFCPRPASQGLPPEDPETCQNWVKNLLEIGQNFLAWREENVIGHVSLVPDMQGKSAEFVIFVDQSHRNLGIGTELTRFALKRSSQLGYDSIWLTVNVSNFIAIKLYKKLGFDYYDRDGSERLMNIKLRKVHR